MAKAPDAFRTISEVAETLDTPPHVLRFWESKFSQVKPVKRAGGRRYYRPDDLALLGGIKTLLHDQGQTIKSAQKALREQGVKAISALYTDAAVPPDDQHTIDHVAPADHAEDSASLEPNDHSPVDDIAAQTDDTTASPQNVVQLPRKTAAPVPTPAPRPDPGPRVLGLAVRAVRDGHLNRDALAPLIHRLDDISKRLATAQ